MNIALLEPVRKTAAPTRRRVAALLALPVLLAAHAGGTAHQLRPVSYTALEQASGTPRVEVRYEGGRLGLRFTADVGRNVPVDLAGRVYCRGSDEKLYGAGALGRQSVATEWRVIAAPPKCDKYVATAEAHYAGESRTGEWAWDYGDSPGPTRDGAAAP